MPESGDLSRRLSPDVLGGLLAVLGLGGVIYALTDGAANGWSNPRVPISLAVGIGSLIALVPVERRLRSPMLRLSLFKSRQFDGINAMTVLYYGALAAAGYLVVLQCQLQMGYTPTQAGAALIPASAVFLVLSPISGTLTARLGPRRLMVAGILAFAVGLLWLSTAEAGSGYVETILPGALLWGLGIGLAVTPLTAAVLAAVGDPDLGEAASISDAASPHPRYPNIMTPDRMTELGLMTSLPACFGAVPCVASKNAISSPMFASGAMPRPPTCAAQASDR